MCTTNVYTTVYPDGRKETSRMPTLCSHSRHGIPCSRNVVFQHPTSYASNAGKSSSAPTSSPFLPTGGHLPPSPAYTPRSGTPNNYPSGNESDRSGGYRSGSSSRSKKSPTVYINGQRVYELDPHSSPSSSSSSRRRKDHVVVNGPPSPHTPPGAFAAPPSSSSSPSDPYIVEAKPRRSSSSRAQPVVIENPRPLSGIDVVDPREYHRSSRYHHASSSSRPSKHARHGSTSSYDSSSRRSHDGEEADAARRRRRERKQQEYEQAERDYSRRAPKWNDRIAAANANIASRPAVPMPPPPPRRSNTATYRDADLVDALHGLRVDDGGSGSSSRRRLSRAQEAEDEAMKQRLKDRMMPRRATVSGRPPRHQVRYDDGTVRWE